MVRRTAEYAARNRGEDFDRLKYATEQTFELTPLPCWSHLSAEAYQERVASLVTEIESEAAAELATMGSEPLGVAAILRQHPHTRPSRTKKSPAPFYHAATKVVRKAFWQAYATFLSAFREAADRWREGVMASDQLCGVDGLGSTGERTRTAAAAHNFEPVEGGQPGASGFIGRFRPSHRCTRDSYDRPTGELLCGAPDRRDRDSMGLLHANSA